MVNILEQIKQEAFEDEMQKLSSKTDPGGKLFKFFAQASKAQQKRGFKPGETPWQYKVEKRGRGGGKIQTAAGIIVPKQ